jgi:uncharacterized protein
MNGPRIPLEAAREAPLRFSDATVTLPFESFGEPLVSLSPLSLSGEITAVGDDYLLDSRLAYSGELECSRCLAAFPFSQSPAVRLRLRPRAPAGEPKGRPEEEVELSSDDLDVAFFDDGMLPLEDIVREQVLIGIPMKPLCREDCRGLCSSCGTELNSGACTCTEKPIDPRLEVLKNFR